MSEFSEPSVFYHESQQEVVLPELSRTQDEILDALENARERGVKSGYIDVAMGLGKSRAAAEDIKAHREQKMGECAPHRTLVLCHNSDILRHVRSEFVPVLGGVTHGDMFGGSFQDQEDVVYATFQTLTRPLGGGKVYQAFDPKEFDYIYVDEGHHAPAPTYREVIEHFTPGFLLAGTGTSERRDKQDIAEIFGKVVYSKFLDEAIAEGELVNPDYRLLTDHVRRLKEVQTDIGSISLSQLNRQIFVPRRDGEIAEMVYEHTSAVKNPKTLVYVPTIKYAEHIQDFLPGDIATYHSGVDPKELTRRMKAFESGELNTLISVDKFNEGVNFPDVNVLVFLRSTASKAIFLQQLGRGLRKAPGKDSVLALDFAASWERIKMVQRIANDISYQHKRVSKNRPKTAKPDQSVKFDFSDEALEAIKVVEMVRRHKGTKDTTPLVPKALLLKQRAEEMLGASLPTQASRFDAGFEANPGDDDHIDQLNEFLIARLGRIYAAAEKYAQEDGNPQLVEDYFQDIFERISRELQSESGSGDIRNIVNQALHRAHRDNKGNYYPITLTIHSAKMLQSIIDAKNEYFRKNNVMPIEGEIAELTGLSEEEVEMLLGIHNMLSMDEVGLEISGGYDSTEEIAIGSLIPTLVNRSLIEHLPPREREILLARAELVDHMRPTLQELSRKWNVSPSRVSQIEQSAMVKLAENAFDLRGWIHPDSYLLSYRDRHVLRDVEAAWNLMDQRRNAEVKYRRQNPDVAEMRDQTRTKNYIISRYKGGEDLGDLERYTQGVKQVIVEAFEVQARRYVDFSIQQESIYKLVDDSLRGKGLQITDNIPWTLIRKMTDELIDDGTLTKYEDQDKRTRIRYTQIFEGPDQEIDKT